MAACAGFHIKIEGRGGHSGNLHECINPVLVGAHLITTLQQIVACNVDPREPATVSICVFHAGISGSIVPETAQLEGRIRTTTQTVRQLIHKRIREVVAGTAESTGAKIEVSIGDGYPVTYNHEVETDLATLTAKKVAGDDKVIETPLVMGSEDFSYMLQARPGAFIFCGNGTSAGLHHPSYNFDDEAILHGAS